MVPPLTFPDPIVYRFLVVLCLHDKRIVLAPKVKHAGLFIKLLPLHPGFDRALGQMVEEVLRELYVNVLPIERHNVHRERLLCIPIRRIKTEEHDHRCERASHGSSSKLVSLHLPP